MRLFKPSVLGKAFSHQRQQVAEIDAVFDTPFELTIQLGIFLIQIARSCICLALPDAHIGNVVVKSLVAVTHILPHRQSVGLQPIQGFV